MAYKSEADLYHHYHSKPESMPQKMSMKIVVLTAVDWSALEYHLKQIMADDDTEDQKQFSWAERVLDAIKEPLTGVPVDLPD